VLRRELLAGAGALVLAPGAFARSLGGMPTALVTADLESHVVAVELGTGRVAKRIATLAGPRSIESSARTAVVAHTEGGALSLVDAASLRVRAVVRGFGAPRYTAIEDAGRWAYVTDSGHGEVVTVDLIRGRVVHRVDVGGAARHLSIDPFGRWLWVALGTKAERVAVLSLEDAAAPRVTSSFAPPFLAHDVGFAPGGRTVWVTSGDRPAAAIHDARTGRLLRRLDADAAPQHVTFAGRRAYVASGDDGTLRVHELGGRVLRAAAVPTGSYNVQEGWGRVLTPSLSQGTLCVLGRDGRVLRRVRVARSSHDACFVISA
jgi:DNA-binding beta-propeller fold protein YncE